MGDFRASSATNVDAARAHFRAGRILCAREALGDPVDPAACIEAVRIALQLGDYALAQEYAQRAHACGSREQALLARVMGDCAAQLRGQPAGTPLDLCEIAGVQTPLLSEIVYYTALTAYYRGEFEAAELWLRAHAPADLTLRARYLVMRGLAAGAQERFDEQARLTRQALELARSEDSWLDVPLVAGAAHILAALVREIPLTDGLALLEEIERTLPWTSDVDFSHCHVLRTLAWAYALQGLNLDAMRLLMRAQEIAHADALRIYVLCDHASVALFAGDLTWARTAFLRADEYAREIDWALVTDEMLAVLPLLATVGAEVEVERARAYVALAQRHVTQMAPRWSLAHGARLPALVDESYALAHADDRFAAVPHARAAYDAFAAIGYAWRAARMAILLLRLTGKVEWRSCAEEHLATYERSPFARVLRVIAGERIALSMQQRRVLELLLQRLSVDEIAQTLGNSPATVRVHLKRIYHAYGVHSRAELLAKAQAIANA